MPRYEVAERSLMLLIQCHLKAENSCRSHVKQGLLLKKGVSYLISKRPQLLCWDDSF